ncbi:hypothetical protein HK103_000436 [Boothiomyces macroporosus]|uniref:F-box domain-containing protein n=1 Tax=Boothiomyces macroporosus TaxID=261099 RepID=A0AAD5UBE4_9FUNG|nr:hypothetical protein HK103_000436 [Boothiomyces macroporosus]
MLGLIDSLPQDILEYNVLYHLNGVDLNRLASTCKSLQQRFKPLADIIRKSEIHPLQAWPVLYLQSHQMNKQLLQNLKQSTLLFQEVILNADTYYELFNIIPKTKRLSVTLGSYYQTFLHPSNVMKITVDQISNLTVKGMDRGNIGFATDLSRFREMRLKELAFIESRDFIVSLASVLPYLSITKLVLSHCAVGNTQLKLLTEALTRTRVLYLDITSLNITEEGTVMFAQLLCQTKFKSLIIRNCPIRKAGADALAESLPFTQVKALHLENNSFSQDDNLLLFDSLPSTLITDFYCDGYTSIQEQELLSNILPFTKITNLSVFIEPKYLVSILENTNLEKLKVIGSNGDYICEALGEIKDIPKYLDLSFTEISIHGLSALISNLRFKNTTSLNLTGCSFKSDGLMLLKDYLPDLGLKYLSLGNENFVTYEHLDDISLDMVSEFLNELQYYQTHLIFNHVNYRNIVVDVFGRKFVEHKGKTRIYNVNEPIEYIDRKGRSDGKCKYFDA